MAHLKWFELGKIGISPNLLFSIYLLIYLPYFLANISEIYLYLYLSGFGYSFTGFFFFGYTNSGSSHGQEWKQDIFGPKKSR
jgi:hypothetical protein